MHNFPPSVVPFRQLFRICGSYSFLPRRLPLKHLMLRGHTMFYFISASFRYSLPKVVDSEVTIREGIEEHYKIKLTVEILI